MNKVIAWVIAALIVVGGATAGTVYLANRSDNDNDKVATTSQTSTRASLGEPVQNREQVTKENCLADTCLRISNLDYPVATLPATLQTALAKALSNEYKTQTYYQTVIGKFGDLRPFAMIVGAEAQHASVITSLQEKYGVTPKANEWSSSDFSLTTFSAACSTAATYERDTVSLYNGLLPQVSNYPDMTQVFTNIRDAARDSHLPAFEKCATTSTTSGTGSNGPRN